MEPMTRQNGNSWDGGDDPLWLLTPDELAQLPDDTVLGCIDGTTVIKGHADLDDDTRFGVTAYGLRESQFVR